MASQGAGARPKPPSITSQMTEEQKLVWRVIRKSDCSETLKEYFKTFVCHIQPQAPAPPVTPAGKKKKLFGKRKDETPGSPLLSPRGGASNGPKLANEDTESRFLKMFLDSLKCQDFYFLVNVPRSAYSPLPKIPINTLRGAERESFHPESERFNECQKWSFGLSVSTYPFTNTEQTKRQGDPICDAYCFKRYGNRTLFAVADGCNWGQLPREAAIRACTKAVNYLESMQNRIRDILEAGLLVIRAVSEAHEAVFEGKDFPEEAGSTTLICGVILELRPDKIKETNASFAIVLCSIGDCKAFLYRPALEMVEDITAMNRGGNSATDCGGRLGFYNSGYMPDLRNLAVNYALCQEGDILFAVSDGVHDNLDPQHLGLMPRTLEVIPPVDEDHWEFEQCLAVKSKFQCAFLYQKLLKDLEEKTPDTISNSIIDHCLDTTKPTRDFMEADPDAVQPVDYKNYPGKMDHTTILTILAGYDFEEGAAVPASAKPPTIPQGKPAPKVHIPRPTSSDEEPPPLPGSPRTQQTQGRAGSRATAAVTREQNVPVAGGAADSPRKQLRIQEPAQGEKHERGPASKPIPRSRTVPPPVLVSCSLSINTFNVYCRTLSKGRFTSSVKESNLIVRMKPEPFTIPSGEQATSFQDVNQVIVRVVPLPASVDPNSKKATYDAAHGIIKITFLRT